MSITIYKNNWTNKAHTALFDRLYFPATSFKRMEENMNVSGTIVFTTELFFGKFVSAVLRGTPPWTPIFLFILLFL